MKAMYLILAAGLLTECSPSFQEKDDADQVEQHAKQIALSGLGIHAPSVLVDNSVRLERISSDTVDYYTRQHNPAISGYLVRYQLSTRDTISNQVAFVTADDSVFAFYPFRHVAEFNQKYGTRY